ncbi:MAG: S-layer homology domain-containing protein, partial [Clostridia bacterium]|nr:S-layer homology domain-containing protein [Clostridia bacterium]
MKKALLKSLLLILCVVVFITPTAISFSASHPFTDVPDWADVYVSEVYNNGIMNGTDSSGKVFNPNGSFTREQLVVTLYRMSGSNVTGTTASLSKTFADGADVSSWAVNAV